MENEDDWHKTHEQFDAGKHGKEYEIEIAKFVFKRILDRDFKNFKFTREKKGLGKFDDLTYVCEGKNGRKFALVQLKHVLDETKKLTYEGLAEDIKSYFFLPKYFSHYLQSVKTISIDRDFDNCELEELIICTNIGFDQDLEDIKLASLNDAGLFEGLGLAYKLELSDSAKQKIFSECFMTDREKLAKELVFHLLIDKVIKIDCLKLDDHVSAIKDYHVALAKDVVDNSTKQFREEFVRGELVSGSETSKFRQSLFDILKEFYLEYQSIGVCEFAKKYKIKRHFMEILKDRMNEYESSSSEIEFLSNMKLNIVSSFGNPSIYSCDTETLPSHDVDVTEVKRQIDSFLKLLTFVVKASKSEKIVREEMCPELYIAFCERMDAWYYVGGSGKRRKWITKEMLITEAMEMDIYFQGQLVKMNDMNIDKSLMTPEVLMSCFCGVEITVGEALPEIGEVRNYYIPRIMKRKRRLQISVLKNDKKNVFLIGNLQSNDKEKIECIIDSALLMEDTSSFSGRSFVISVAKNFTKELLDEFIKTHDASLKNKNIHWLSYENDHLVWQYTVGSLVDLQQYFIKDERCSELFDEGNLIEESLAIINGEPGMGKSTLLSSIIEKMVKSNIKKGQPNWIVRLSLKACFQVYANNSQKENPMDFFEFLAHFANANDQFSKGLLRELLRQGKRVFMFLDGYDELSSEDQQSAVRELVFYVKKCSEENQAWITTRTHYKEKLENSLGSVSFSMMEINEDEQVFFLSNYWKFKCERDERVFKTYAQDVIVAMNSNVNNRERSFLGIPLQTFMFAVVFLEEVVKENPAVPENFPVTSLFEKFLETKYMVYLRKSRNGISPKKMQLMKKLLDNVHQDYALLYGGVFSVTDAELFVWRCCTFKEKELLEIGILYKGYDNMQFVHKTFAEYLIAKRLVEVALGKHKYRDEHLRLLEEGILKAENIFLLYLFDHKLTEKFPLHHSVLNGDMNQIKELSEDELNERDCLGRAPMYYAVRYDHSDIVNILIERDVQVDFEIFTRKALISRVEKYYAVNRNSVSNEELNLITTNHTRLTQHAFKDSAKCYPSDFLYSFSISFETKHKNWTVTDILVRNGYVIDSFPCLINVCRYKAPFDLTFKIAEFFSYPRHSTVPFSSMQDDFVFYFTYVIEYTLECEPLKTEHGLKHFALTLTKLMNKYKLVLSSMLGKFRALSIDFNMVAMNKFNIFQNIFNVYYELSNALPKDSLISLLSYVKTRAHNLAAFVRTLFECKGQWCSTISIERHQTFQEANLKNALCTLLPFLGAEYLQYSIGSLRRIMENDRLTPESIPLLETWNTLKNTNNDYIQDDNRSLFQVICLMITHSLASSQVFKLIELHTVFQAAIKMNNVDSVELCLQKAKEKGWLKALLEVCNDDLQQPEEVVKSMGFTESFEIMNKFRMEYELD